MKTPLQRVIFYILLFCSTIVKAQPTLTSANTNPAIGDSYANNNSQYLSPGSSGANATWDLSAMTVTSSPSATYVSASSTPEGLSFPNANISAGANGIYNYYKTSSSAWQYYGIALGMNVVYSDPEDFLRFPFTYNSTYTDSWAATFVSGTAYYRRGTTTVTGDSYGTLKLPSGTYNNVLRVHFVENYQDSSNSGTPVIQTYKNDQYMWYLPGNHSPIASVYTLTIGTSSPTKTGYYLAGIKVGINENDRLLGSYSLFPNPVSENLNIAFSLTENKKIEIKLYNSIGEEVSSNIFKEGLIGVNEFILDVAVLPEGIYFAQLNLEGNITSTKKFVVSK